MICWRSYVLIMTDSVNGRPTEQPPHPPQKKEKKKEEKPRAHSCTFMSVVFSRSAVGVLALTISVFVKQNG